MKKMLLVLAIASLTGCASNKYLQPMLDGNSAKLRLVSIPSNNNFVSETSPKKCISDDPSPHIATLGVKANLVRSLSRLNMPAYNEEISDSHQNEVYIPAGKEFSFQFNGVGITGFAPGKSNTKDGFLYSWCSKIISFTPTSNSNYEALYDYVELPNGKETCGVKLFEIVKSTNQVYKKVEVDNYQVIEDYCD